METAMRVKFWGVRGSHPVPGEETRRYGGNTPCIEIRVPGSIIILDAGTGIIPLGQDLLRRSKEDGLALNITLLLSHLHYDHLQGLPFFAPAFDPAARLHIFGPAFKGQALEKILKASMSPPHFPITLDHMEASRTIENLQDEQILYLPPSGDELIISTETDQPLSEDGLHIRCIRSDAHPDSVLVYRLDWQGRSVVYATDIEAEGQTDSRLVQFMSGCDLLIHDAQYTEEHYSGAVPERPATYGFGHSTASMACSMAKTVHADRLALFHYEPSYTDRDVAEIESRARDEFVNAFAAMEGLSLIFPPLPAAENASKESEISPRPVFFQQPVFKNIE